MFFLLCNRIGCISLRDWAYHRTVWCFKIQIHRSLDSKPWWKHFGDRKQLQSKTYIEHILKTNNSPFPPPNPLGFCFHIIWWRRFLQKSKEVQALVPYIPRLLTLPGSISWLSSLLGLGLLDLNSRTRAPLQVSGTSSKALLGASAPQICLTPFSSCCLAFMWILFVLSSTCPKPPLVEVCPDIVDHSHADPGYG